MPRTPRRRTSSASRPQCPLKKQASICGDSRPRLSGGPGSSGRSDVHVGTTAAPVSPALQRELITKRRGELAELAFTFKATGLGFAVSKPYGDSERYDFIVDSHEPDAMPKLYRVQVKCSTVLLDNQYHVNAHRRVNGRAVPYKLTDMDFFAAYVIPEDSWFIIPLRDVLGVVSFLFRCKGDRRRGTYDRYREAWHLFREPDGIVIA